MGYEGRTVLNYHLVRKLGEGGFGEVYLAEHVELGRRAACKILYREFAQRDELVARFFREAKAVCAIGHRAIVDVQNYGKLDNGEPFYLMEYFPGSDLSTVIRERGALPMPWVTTVFDPVASALTAAHGKGVIHRDLKPENIMVRVENEQVVDVKLLDFGIAKLADMSDPTTSRTGIAMGTPTFMAPEQARDAKNVDQRADVYGFAATLFAAISGQPPFSGASVTDVIVAVQTHPPPRISTLVPHVNPVLDDTLVRCLAKQPHERPSSIEEAWSLLRASLAPGQPGYYPRGASSSPWEVTAMPHATTPAPAPASGGPVTTLRAATGARASGAAPGRRPGFALAGAAILAVAVAGIAAVVLTVGGDDAPRSDEPALAADAGTATTVAATEAADAAPVAALPAAIDAAAAPTPEAAPEPECSADSFTSLLGRTWSKQRREQILARASECREAGKITAALHERVEAGLRPRTRHAGAARKPPRRDGDADKPKRDRPAARPSCSRASFAKVYSQPSPSGASVRAALKRLKDCRASGAISGTEYGAIQSALIAKL